MFYLSPVGTRVPPGWQLMLKTEIDASFLVLTIPTAGEKRVWPFSSLLAYSEPTVLGFIRSCAVLCVCLEGLSETAASRGRGKKNPLSVLFFFQIKENMILEFCTKIIVIFFILQAPLKFIFTVPILKPLQRNCLWGLFDFLLKKIKNRWVSRHLHLSF